MWRWLLLVLGASAAAGCGDDAECVIDTDCPLPMRCEAEQCVPRGELDAGGVDGSTDMDGGPDAGELDGGTDAGPALVKRGTVLALQTPLADVGTSPHAFTATFTVTPESDTCSVETVGECSVSDCLVPAMGDADAGVPDGGTPADAGAAMDAGTDGGVMAVPSAGTIIYTGGLVDLVLTADADGTYAPRTGTGLLWNTDQSVTIMGSGAEVPSFSETLTGPGQITVTAPSFATPPLTIDRAGDWTVTWSGGTGTVRILLSNSQVTTEGTRTVQLDCTYEAAATTATIPSATLEMLPTGPGGSLEIATAAQATATPDDEWQVSVAVASRALADTGSAASISTTITDSTP